jgi:hypothetical protein
MGYHGVGIGRPAVHGADSPTLASHLIAATQAGVREIDVPELL